MIKYEWRDVLEPEELDELSDLLRRAAEYDAEPEYTTIRLADVVESMSRRDPSVRHLVIWMLPYATAIGERDEPERIAGLLRVVTDAQGAAEAAIVVDPRLRSIGISTSLLERVGGDCTGPDGWLGTGAAVVSAWAQGNHPAAGRLSNRFLIPPTLRVWKLIRGATDFGSNTAASVLEILSRDAGLDLEWAAGVPEGDTHVLRDGGRAVGVMTLNSTPVDSEEFGSCATITGYRVSPTASAKDRRALLDGAAALVHEFGLSGVVIHVDSDASDWVNACRLAGFQHDRTDVRYQLGGQW